MNLNELTRLQGNRKPKKRVGRGGGSGKGFHTTGRGQKGQRSRVGFNLPQGFEGGQVPLYKRLPQMGGFKSFRTKVYTPVSLTMLEKLDANMLVTPGILVQKGLIKTLEKNGAKILGQGKLTKKLTLKGFAFSASAKKAVEDAGCTLEE